MMRTTSLSNVKKSGKKNQENRTTKTKASATKPEMFTMSLARNKYNPNPTLFNSVKKQPNQHKPIKFNKQNYQSEKKRPPNCQNEINLLESLHTKISFDYINSLYSDIGLQFGFRLKNQLENKQNILGQKNLNMSVKLPSKEQKECLDKIGNLIKLKDTINSGYQSMKNTQNILSHVMRDKLTSNHSQNSQNQMKTFPQIHQTVSNFLSYFLSLDNQLQKLQNQYDEHVQKAQEVQQQSQDNEDQAELDAVIIDLQNQLAQQKNLSLRYEKQQKFLISKLYFTQKKNNELKSSSSNLQMKNTNLRDTIRLSISNLSKKNDQQPKQMKRSLSVKLQRIKKYNLNDDTLNPVTQKIQKQLVRSRSTSSLGSGRFSSTYLLNRQKETFLDKIF